MGKKKGTSVSRRTTSASDEERYQRFKAEATELFQAALDFYHRYQPPEGYEPEDEGLTRTQNWVSCLAPISCLVIRFDFDPRDPGGKGKS